MGLPGKEGLVHISQLAHHRVAKTEDIVKEGETILVKATGYDNQGRLKLSRKEALPPPPPGSEEMAEAQGQGYGGAPGGPPRRDRDRGPRPPRGPGRRDN